MPIPQAAKHSVRPALADVVMRQLRQVIEDGQLEPGEAIDEQAIEAWTGASRTPVREAIDRLAAIGLLDVQPQRTTRVSVDDRERVRATLRTLDAFLPACVSLVLPVLSQPERTRLASLLIPNGRALFVADGMLAELVRLVGNDRVTRTWDDLAPFVRRHWNLVPDDAPAFEQEDIDALRTAIADADADRASAVLSAWFQRVASREGIS
ncbi:MULTISPECIES: GntR family transcriptional regulator [unclassified Curtobacterium]|uniref:GntR family transcriptional regulator n=1 Tax=unclassified Curtobacterium TaxID=257496 RepID=UPI0013591100|nr:MULTISPECIES: GntR family transcriptional regulator [unclassified Curtobacterium]MBF4588391.1 GntR family transcriptional regulator [Curtobacterium sp. VKM Ac-2887]